MRQFESTELIAKAEAPMRNKFSRKEKIAFEAQTPSYKRVGTLNKRDGCTLNRLLYL